jgi:pimeloyl-ACP methyl ester carboxylesterase
VLQASETRYARSGEVSIAYRVLGDGPVDVVNIPPFISNVELMTEHPRARAYRELLTEFCRLIVFDKRGTGLSDRVRDVPTLETRMDDVRAVMDAAGSERAVILGESEGGPMSVLFAATYPERVLGLVMCGSYARGTWAPDYPWAPRPDEVSAVLQHYDEGWGTDPFFRQTFALLAPNLVDDEESFGWYARLLRLSVSPGAAKALFRMSRDVDVRDVLPAIRVPTLVLEREGGQVEEGRYIAERIPGARFVVLPGTAHIIWAGDYERFVAEVRRFVDSIAAPEEPDTVLATILFTDIVGSTDRAAELGDRRWTELVSSHHAVVRRQLDRFRGREVDTAGDGFFATFDGPIRAIRCARAIGEGVRELGLDVRAGLHTGECQLVGEKVGGLAVNIGARVAARAGAGEVLVSQTVKDLVAGADIAFADRGLAELKGVPGEWRLWAVESA